MKSPSLSMHLFIACFAALGAQINVANVRDNRINRELKGFGDRPSYHV